MPTNEYELCGWDTDADMTELEFVHRTSGTVIKSEIRTSELTDAEAVKQALLDTLERETPEEKKATEVLRGMYRKPFQLELANAPDTHDE